MFPGPIEIPVDGQLRFAIFASITDAITARVHVKIKGKIRKPLDHEFAHPSGNRSAQESFMDVPENSEIVGLNVFIKGITTRKRGECYVRVHLMHRGVTMLNLGEGYLYNGGEIVLGRYIESGPGGGNGFIRSITGTNRAAGTELSEVVPSDAVWRLMCLRVSVLGGAAGFGPRFEITDGTTQLWRSQFTTVGAAATEILVLASGQNHNEAGTTHFELPEGLFLDEGYEIQTTDITGDDDYAAPQLWVEEWIVV